jgi:putative transposase
MCYILSMNYRTIEIHWLPKTSSQWRAFSAARKEAARLWGDLVERHHRIRRRQLTWPNKQRWQQWAKGRYPGLSAQSVQQIIGQFCEAVHSARQLRNNGHTEARYPWKKPRYRDVVYTNQDARIKYLDHKSSSSGGSPASSSSPDEKPTSGQDHTNQDARLRHGRLILPHGRNGHLRIPIPVELPGRLMEVRLSMGAVRLVCQVPDTPQYQQTIIGVDLGVNTLLAATDGEQAILVSGRAAKATVQYRQKRLAECSEAQSRKTKGSRVWKRLQRRKAKMLAKCHWRLRDLMHKATRKVAEAFPGATCYVGKPFNDAAQRIGRRQAQQVSSACNARLIAHLDYKTCGAIQVDEAYTSQTCPVCGARNKNGRRYRCRSCGQTAPRDVIGSLNILAVGRHHTLVPGRRVPNTVLWVHPVKYSGHKPDSSSGHLASSLG